MLDSYTLYALYESAYFYSLDVGRDVYVVGQ